MRGCLCATGGKRLHLILVPSRKPWGPPPSLKCPDITPSPSGNRAVAPGQSGCGLYKKNNPLANSSELNTPDGPKHKSTMNVIKATALCRSRAVRSGFESGACAVQQTSSAGEVTGERAYSGAAEESQFRSQAVATRTQVLRDRGRAALPRF